MSLDDQNSKFVCTAKKEPFRELTCLRIQFTVWAPRFFFVGGLEKKIHLRQDVIFVDLNHDHDGQECGDLLLFFFGTKSYKPRCLY